MHRATAEDTTRRPIPTTRVVPTESTNQIRLSAAYVAGGLAAIALVLIILGTVGQIARWQFGIVNSAIAMFDLEAEKNAPALYSGLIMLIAAAIVWIIQHLEVPGAMRRKWQVLGAGMLLMSLDEVFRIHERPTDLVRSWLGEGDLGVFTYAWVLPALILLPFIGLYFLSFLKALPAATARGFIASGLLFLFGSVGLEMVGGWYFAQYGFGGELSAIAIIEEACEFFGICLFIYFALKYLSRRRQPAELSFGA